MNDEGRIGAEAARDEQESVAKRRRRWGCFVYAAIFLLLPALILLAVGTVLVVADQQAAEEALERARDTGDPLTLVEMQAFYGETPRSAEATEKWIAVAAATRFFSEHVDRMKMPDSGMHDAAPTYDDRGLYDEATLARVKPMLEGAGAEALERAHAARDLASDVRFPIRYEEGWNAYVDEIQQLRETANLLALEAEVRTAEGDLTGATESLLTLISVSETLAETPDPTTYLVRLAIFGVATHYGMRLIDAEEFPPEDLKRLQEAYSRQTFHPHLLRATQGHQLQSLLWFEAGAPAEPVGSSRSRRYPLRGRDLAMTLDLLRQFLDGAEGGFIAADRAADVFDAQMQELEDSDFDDYQYAGTLDFMLAIHALVSAGIRAEAQARMCAACCACERHRQEHGEWPASLATLVPEYLDDVPLDPVDERPLRYEVDGERMIIHSVAHFRPENDPDGRTLEEGFACHVLGEPYVPEPTNDAVEAAPD